jgi:hypothetical protein
MALVAITWRTGRRAIAAPRNLLRLRVGMLIRASIAVGAVAPAIGLGVLVGMTARGTGGEMGWVYATLILSAVVVAITQQTLP